MKIMLDIIEETQFILQLPLKKLHRFGKGFVCSCPVCNEGASKHKKRCYILLGNNRIDHNTVYCFNCGLNTSIKKFIEIVMPSLSEEYRQKERSKIFSTISEKKLFTKPITSNVEIETEANIKYEFNLSTETFIPARLIKKCVDYCKERKIYENIDSLYYCNKEGALWNDMLVFPFWKDDKVYGFQGRRMDKKLFNTFSPDGNPKIYNIFNVDVSKPVYITEAIIDSMMLDNSIAMLGSALSGNMKSVLKQRVWVFDADTTGYTKAMNCATAGEKVCILPNEIREKDLNDMVRNGFTKKEIHDIVNENIYEGLSAITKLKMKLMNKRR